MIIKQKFHLKVCLFFRSWIIQKNWTTVTKFCKVSKIRTFWKLFQIAQICSIAYLEINEFYNSRCQFEKPCLFILFQHANRQIRNLLFFQLNFSISLFHSSQSLNALLHNLAQTECSAIAFKPCPFECNQQTATESTICSQTTHRSLLWGLHNQYFPQSKNFWSIAKIQQKLP